MTKRVKKQSSQEKQLSRLKPREKLKEFGIKNLTNVELLSVVLGSGTAKLSVFNLAHSLLNSFSLEKILKTPSKELIKFPGLGVVKAGQVLAAIELGQRSLKISALPKILTATDAVKHLENIRQKKREHVVCLYLNGRHELIHQETVAIGGLNYSLLEPRDVFGPALRIPAPYIILGHNHPSGSAKPSSEDHQVTEKLKKAGELLGVTLLDHLVIGKNNYFSLITCSPSS